jgi:hypothetical protein
MSNDDLLIHLRASAVRDLLRRDGDTISAWAGRAGISEPYAFKLLSGERRCGWDLLIRLATALRVEPTTIADVSARVAA